MAIEDWNFWDSMMSDGEIWWPTSKFRWTVRLGLAWVFSLPDRPGRNGSLYM